MVFSIIVLGTAFTVDMIYVLKNLFEMKNRLRIEFSKLNIQSLK